MRPALILNGWLIFPDGRIRKASIWERYLWWRGKLKTVKVGNAKHEFF